jgi:MazG family protein
LLFQIVFYAQVAAERGEFNIQDVTHAVHSKMVRRHPHVFGAGTAQDTAEVLRNWEAIKAEEKRAAGKAPFDEDDASLLDGVSRKAPALMEAHQLSTKASRVGFDWQRIEDIFDKLQEELDELRQAMQQHAATAAETDHTRVREEVGDVLFALTNIARALQVEPEAALKVTNRKFRRRFRHIEQGLKMRGRSLDAATLEEMEALWQEAKRSEE